MTIYTLASSESNSGHFAIVLEEVGGSRRLPILIGMAEAQAIAFEIQKIKPTRPMTHDLMVDMCRHFGVTLREIVIMGLKEGTFFAKLILINADGTHELDCRPSDGIALAVRFDASIYVNENILEEAGVEKEDLDIAEERSVEAPARRQAAPKKQAHHAPKTDADNIEELNQKLEEALRSEDYELAALIRDKISKIQQ